MTRAPATSSGLLRGRMFWVGLVIGLVFCQGFWLLCQIIFRE